MWWRNRPQRRFVLALCGHALMFVYLYVAVLIIMASGAGANIEPLASMPTRLYWSLFAAHAALLPVSFCQMVRVACRGMKRVALPDLEFALHKRAARLAHNTAPTTPRGLRVD